MKAILRHRLADGVEALAQKRRPVIGLDRIQRFDDVLKGVGDDAEAAVIDAEESAGKIIQRSGTFGMFAYPGVGIEPDQRGFVVVILEALPVLPGLRPARVDD
jgi:hypothetical protein